MEIILPYSPPAVVTAIIAQRRAHRVSSFMVMLVSLWKTEKKKVTIVKTCIEHIKTSAYIQFNFTHLYNL